MPKIQLTKPVLIYLYGFPGSGKSYVARNLEDVLEIARIDGDRIRHELFSRPRYDAQENAIVSHLMNYMAGEFLRAGVSVVYDANALRAGQRRKLREMARNNKATSLLVWLQIDPENSFARTQQLDRRTTDDKYTQHHSQESFQHYLSLMQNPKDEDYLVISGKHAFVTQKNAILNRLYQMGHIQSSAIQSTVAKPELINLIPNPHAGRVDLSRRNITIG